ncbi:MAG: hypothetical protein Q8S23_08200 [Bacteroidales bacterium]|nr:hypothetical protein [Bacteroidales bacterium]
MSSILSEIFTHLVTGLSTAIAGGTFIHFRAKRKTEDQKARQEENAADSGRFSNLEREIQFLDKRLESYRYVQQIQDKKMAGMQKLITVVIGQKRYAEQHICLNLPCLDRIPNLGEFSTEEPKLDKTSHEKESM